MARGCEPSSERLGKDAGTAMLLAIALFGLLADTPGFSRVRQSFDQSITIPLWWNAKRFESTVERLDARMARAKRFQNASAGLTSIVIALTFLRTWRNPE
jgi:hypothetical protein